ncbi:MAG: IS66 family transposase [Alphaproteobacteria bacterium]|nr:IS66 family transposase [Alphaproteobacteria bacterium]
MAGLAEILEENQRLRRLLVEREALIVDREAAIAQHATVIADREAVIVSLEQSLREQATALEVVTAQRDAVKRRAEQLAQALEFIELKRRGPASMRFIPGDEQGVLPIFPDLKAPPRLPVAEDDEAKTDEATPAPTKKPRTGTSPRRRGRQDFNHLPSRTIHCPASDDGACTKCGGDLRVIGQATSFRIGWVPGHFVVEDIVRDKCACPKCPGEGVLTVPGPFALDKALCADSLLARVLVDKFADHLPLHRQAARMGREGFEVGTNTLASWVVQAAAAIFVIADAVRKDVLANDFVQGDDTGFPVQDGGDGKLRKGRMWAFTDQEQVFYAFTDTKQGKFPVELLADFQGDCLLADGGSEFNKAVAELDLQRAGCWSHLRTYFFDALPFHPDEAALALGTLRDLFLLERSFRELGTTDRLAARQAESAVLVEGLMAWVKALSPVARPKSKLMAALTYATNQEAALRAFLQRGDIPIHNNLSELMLRQHVVGRKNWLFARNEGGARAAATMFTLIGSCRLQGIDPHTYLVDVLGRVQDYPATRVAELTPRAWRLAQGRSDAAG